ncbi:MAG TPA: hypothetical protein VNA11_02360 [Pseudonocardia sp.]|nr:hypothetical protein [Pseudonocardia sp.]
MQLPADEPECRPWNPITVGELWTRVLEGRDTSIDRPWVVAVDGRGGSGKSFLADRLVAAAPFDAEVVHTDDVAWHHSFFGWDDLLAEEILAPARERKAVRFVPPAWRERGRVGAITVSSSCSLLVVEGSGSYRRRLEHLYDVGIYVQADADLALRRLLARDGDTPADRAFIAEWDREEQAVMAAGRPWARADVVLAGTRPEGLSVPSDLLVVGSPAQS